MNEGGTDKIALSQFTTKHQSFGEDVELVQRSGLRGLELCESKLADNPGIAADQLRALRDSGLPVCSVQPRVHAVFPDQMAPEPAKPGTRLDLFRHSMDRVCDALPEQHPTFVLISGRAPDHDLARGREELAAAACTLAEEAGQRGCRIAFETLNPVMMNEDSFVCMWDEALTLAEMVGREDFGLVCDLWNVWQEPGILESVRASIDQVFLVHLSDWRDGGPRRLNDRLIPGRGVIPLAAWGAMLQDAQYPGWMCLEMLSDRHLEDSFYHLEPAEVVAESRQHLQAAGLCA